MPVTNYHTVNGKLRGETTNGVRTNYLTDGLGSITATVDSNADVVNTYRHKPFGALLAKTGGGPDPKFLWAGDTGSRASGLAHAEQYNLARHYGSESAGWTTRDSLWPREAPYGYVGNNPTTDLDPVGEQKVPRCYSIGIPIRAEPTTGIAVTACNSDTGIPYAWICLPKTHYLNNCIVQHEEQHRTDYAACCMKLKECLDSFMLPNGLILPGGFECTNTYLVWFKQANLISECRAYKVSRRCFEETIRRKKCTRKSTDLMCRTLISHYDSDARQIKKICNELPAPWKTNPDNPLPECKFKFKQGSASGG